MNIFSRIYNRCKSWLRKPQTQCEQALTDELNRKAIQEITPLVHSIRAMGVGEKESTRIVQFFRDQRNAGVNLEVATWRSRQKLLGPGKPSEPARVTFDDERSRL